MSRRKKAAFKDQQDGIYRELEPDDVIFHGDESGFQYAGKPKKCLTPRGCQPRLRSQGGHKKVNVVGAINPFSGEFIFQEIDRFDAPAFQAHLEEILKQNPGPGKIYYFLDNSRVHHARLLHPFLATHQDKLILKFLPPYSPEFNEEIEGVWREIKKKVVYNGYYASFNDFKDALETTLKGYQFSSETLQAHCNPVKHLLIPLEAEVCQNN